MVLAFIQRMRYQRNILGQSAVIDDCSSYNTSELYRNRYSQYLLAEVRSGIVSAEFQIIQPDVKMTLLIEH